MRERGRIGRFSPTSIKIMQDGVCENFTAAVIDPYLDAHGESTGNRGISFVDPEALKGYVRARPARLPGALPRPRRAGRARGPRCHRGRVGRERCERQLAPPGAYPGRPPRRHPAVPTPARRGERTAALGGPRVADGRLDDPFLGEPRWRWQYPFASLVRAGATLAMGSDWSVSSPDPLEEIHVAVNRRMPPSYPHRVERHDVFIPDERLDLARRPSRRSRWARPT